MKYYYLSCNFIKIHNIASSQRTSPPQMAAKPMPSPAHSSSTNHNQLKYDSSKIQIISTNKSKHKYKSKSKLEELIFNQCQQEHVFSNKIAQEIFKQKLIISQYSQQTNKRQKFANKLTFLKKSPRKKNQKQCQITDKIDITDFKTDNIKQNHNKSSNSQQNLQCTSDKRENKQYEFFHNIGAKTKQQQMLLASKDNKLNTFRSKSSVSLKMKQRTSHQKKIKLIIKRKNIENDQLPKIIKLNTSTQIYQQLVVQNNEARQNKEGVKGQVLNKRCKYFEIPTQIRRQTYQKHGEIIHNNSQKLCRIKGENRTGNFKSACDEFRIRKKNNYQSSRIQDLACKFSQQINSQHKESEQICCWSVGGIQNNIQKQNGSRKLSCQFRNQQIEIDEMQFMQFLDRSKTNMSQFVIHKM